MTRINKRYFLEQQLESCRNNLYTAMDEEVEVLIENSKTGEEITKTIK